MKTARYGHIGWEPATLDPAYAAVFLDAIVVKVGDNQVVQNKPAYIAIGAGAGGEKHVLGTWLAKTPPQAAAAGEGYETPTGSSGVIPAAA